MKAISTVTPVLIALFLAVACGDDDDSSGGNTGGSGGAGGTGGATKCKSPYENQTAASLKSATASTGKCAADTATICANNMITITSMCGVQCLSKSTTAEQLSCTQTCIQSMAKPAVSDDCAGCYVADVGCSIQHCLAECAAGQSVGCEACRQANGCTAAFYACSGLPVSATGEGGAPNASGGAGNTSGGAPGGGEPGATGGAQTGGAGGTGPVGSGGAPGGGAPSSGGAGGGGAGG